MHEQAEKRKVKEKNMKRFVWEQSHEVKWSQQLRNQRRDNNKWMPMYKIRVERYRIPRTK